VAGAAVGLGAAVAMPTAHASGGFQLEAVHPKWHHNKSWAATYDHRALRRGYEVYRQICSTCHSMRYVNFRNLVGVTHTETQAKMIAQFMNTKMALMIKVKCLIVRVNFPIHSHLHTKTMNKVVWPTVVHYHLIFP